MKIASAPHVNRTLPILILLATAVWAVVSCAPESRYRVLSTFLDGVPPPPGLQIETEASDDKPTSPTLASAGKGRFVADHTAIPAVPEGSMARGSRHQPFGQHECSICHDMTSGMNTASATTAACGTCHGETMRWEKWNHGPINLGNCTPCHRAHESPYPRLLDKPIPDLCLHCHTPWDSDAGTFHAEFEMRPGIDINQCHACHDGHRV